MSERNDDFEAFLNMCSFLEREHLLELQAKEKERKKNLASQALSLINKKFEEFEDEQDEQDEDEEDIKVEKNEQKLEEYWKEKRKRERDE